VTDFGTDFKSSPFYEILETLVPLHELPGNYSYYIVQLKDALTILMQIPQTCRKTATLLEPL
jgi:hypothetical protein